MRMSSTRTKRKDSKRREKDFSKKTRRSAKI